MESEEHGRIQTCTFEEANATQPPDRYNSLGERSNNAHDDSILYSRYHRPVRDRNIEIDWREMDPYFSELSDCASFWTLINFTCDVIYSGLFVLFFIMGQDVESMFFEGLLNHINPILIYLIFSLIINYGALKALRCGRERCFLFFSVSKGLLFPITISVLLYLIFCDVQEYFGTFWVSFVVIISCYNLTAALGLWSMFTCNRYILINEAAQKRIRKESGQQKRNFETECRCSCAPVSQVQPTASDSVTSKNYQIGRSGSNHQTRKVGDSSASNVLTMSMPTDDLCEAIPKGIRKKDHCWRNLDNDFSSVSANFMGGPMDDVGLTSKPELTFRESSDDEVLSFSEDEEVLQISTVHKMMREIRIMDAAKNVNPTRDLSDEGESL